MTQKLKPYPEYKDAGLPWLGKIPAHWIQKSIQAITRIKSIKGRTDLPLLSVYRDYGVIRRDSRNDNYNPEGSDLSTYKVVKPGNLVLNKMKTWQGSLGVSKYIGIVSPAYIVCEVIGNIYPMYLHYLLRSKPYVWFYNQISFGVRSNQWDMRYNDFKRIQIFLPPIQEQCQIATYLKEREKTINHFIHNKQRLFELINEQKQAIINHAVTRGINPNVRLKPSGVEWMGDMSEHWEVMPLKRWVKINEQVLPESTAPEYEIKYLDISSVSTGYLVKNPESIKFRNTPSRARRIMRKGDTIISTVRTYLKAIYFVEEELQNLVASTGFATLTPNKGLYPKFLSYVIQGDSFIDKVTTFSVGIAYPAIAETRLGALHIAMPTSYDEQRLIAEKIERESTSIDTAIRRALREIDLIREYRTRLIADVVTGKVDVRGIPVEIIEGLEGLEDADVQAELQEGEEIEETEEVLDAKD